MRVLLDECVDRRLARNIVGHDVKNAVEMGWSGVSNGELLRRAAPLFDAFVTVDRNLTFQQSLVQFDIAVFVLRARTNTLAELRDLVPRLLEAFPSAKPGEAIFIDR